MSTQELWDLAIIVTGNIAGVAADTAQTSLVGQARLRSTSALHLEKIRMMTLGVLAAKLIEVQFTLESPQSSQEETISRRLPRLLAQLEEVCTWPVKPPINERHNSRDTEIVKFPALQAVLQPSPGTRSALRIALADFASSGGPKVRKLCANLDGFAGAHRTKAQIPNASACVDRHQVEQIVPPKEYPSLVNELMYNTLLQHSRCTCSSSNGEFCAIQKHWARLRLVDKVRFTQEDVLFDVLFSAAPASLSQVVGRSNVRDIRFAVENIPASEGSLEQEQTKVIEIGHFCDLLGRSLGTVCIRLKVMDGRLHQLFQVDAAHRRVVEAPSISLSQVLELEKISPKGRILLAYILAKSVWRYYDSGFMRIKWTTESIHFMREYRLDLEKDMDQEKIDPSSPFFAFPPLDSDLNESTEHYRTWSVLHQYPRVLALGTMLVEIGRKRPKKAAHESRSPEAQINNDFARYMEVVGSTNWPALDVRNEEIRNRYRAAVRSCLDPKIFHVSASTTAGQFDVDARRDILYKHVVFPLEQLCAELGIIDQPEVVELLDYTEAAAKTRKSPNMTLLSKDEKRGLPKSSKEWMEWTMNTGPFDLALRFRESSQTRRVRIAVLDTGYDSKSPFFYSASRHKRLIMWRDFAEGIREPVDRDGHGTYVLSLAMKIAPAADICVARVATNSSDLGKASHNISEAIEWAAETAEADVISMSFGFSEEPEVDDENVISNAIAQALAKRNQRILFFAAAANDGGNQIEMFPARHPSVFSIRATDHQGTFLTLNPPPDFSGVDVLGTLGGDVPAAALSCQRIDSGEVCKTGTSAATPIAAGIAATVLGYARLRLEEETKLDPNTVRLLCTERGMRLMLLQLSRKMGEKQYYLCAENFIRQSDILRDAMLLVISTQAKSKLPQRLVSIFKAHMALKTYLLAPNFTLEPDGSIRIGRIIADPFRPTKPLHIPQTEPTIATHTDFDSSYSLENSHALQGSIWAQFLQTASANVSAGISKDVLTQYTMDSLETIRIKEDPTDKEATELVNHPEVQAAVNAGILGSAPVYMITGIKVAKGFRLTTQVARTHEVQVGASAPITEDVGIGAEVGISRTAAAEDTLRSGSDIIFAYQLHIIARKRWWRKEVSADIYAPPSAFLSEDEHEAVEEEVAVNNITSEQLMSAAEENEDGSVKAAIVLEGGEACVCISFQESEMGI